MMIDEIVKQLRQERDRIQEAIRALSSLSGNTRVVRVKRPTTGRRTLSAAARRQIAAAQRARWARVKSQQKVVPIASKGKRRISAAGIARIRAAAKARWAKVRAAKK